MLSSFASQPLSWEHVRIVITASSILLLVVSVFALSFICSKSYTDAAGLAKSYATFFYVSFLKPHTGGSGDGQQGALESFYKAQVHFV